MMFEDKCSELEVLMDQKNEAIQLNAINEQEMQRLQTLLKE